MGIVFYRLWLPQPDFFCGKDNENNKHFLVHCPLYDALCTDLFDQLSDVPGLDITSINNIDDDILSSTLVWRSIFRYY